jgi:hypothetical protein
MPRRRCLAVLAFAVTAAAHAGFDEGEQAFKRRDFRWWSAWCKAS